MDSYKMNAVIQAVRELRPELSEDVIRDFINQEADDIELEEPDGRHYLETMQVDSIARFIVDMLTENLE